MSVTTTVVRVVAPTATGTQDITVPGFGTPKAARFFLSYADTDGATDYPASLSVGATDGTNQWALGAIAYTYVSGPSTNYNAARRGTTNGVVQLLLNSATVGAAASFSSWITDGVRINWTTVPVTGLLLTVVLYGGDNLSARAGVYTTGTNEGNTTTIALPWQLDTIFFANNGTSLSESFSSTGPLNMGVATYNGTTITQGSVSSLFNQNEYNARGWVSNNRVVINMRPAGDISRATELTSVTATGFTTTQRDVANSFSLQHGYLALNFGGTAQASVVDTSSPTTAGNQSVSTPGITPQYVEHLFGSPTTRNAIGGIVDGGISFGFMTDTNSRSLAVNRVAAYNSEHSYTENVAVLFRPADPGDQRVYGPDLRALRVSLDAEGYTLDWTSVQSVSRLGVGMVIEAMADTGPTAHELAHTVTATGQSAFARDVSFARGYSVSGVAPISADITAVQPLVFTFSWDTTTKDNGPATISAEALGADGAVITTDSRSITIDNLLQIERTFTITAVGQEQMNRVLTFQREHDIATPGVPAFDRLAQRQRTHGVASPGVVQATRTRALQRAMSAIGSGVTALTAFTHRLRSVSTTARGVTSYARQLASTRRPSVQGTSSTTLRRHGVRVYQALAAGVTSLVRTVVRRRDVDVVGVEQTTHQRTLTLQRLHNLVASAQVMFQASTSGLVQLVVQGRAAITTVRHLSITYPVTVMGQAVASVLRHTERARSVVGVGTALYTRAAQYRRQLAVTAQGVASFSYSSIGQFIQTLLVTGQSRVTLVRAASLNRYINVAAPGWAQMKRNLQKGISILGRGVASLTRHSERAETVLGVGTYQFQRQMGRIHSVLVTGVAYVAHQQHQARQRVYQIRGQAQTVYSRALLLVRTHAVAGVGESHYYTGLVITFRNIVAGVSQVRMTRHSMRQVLVLGTSLIEAIQRTARRYKDYVLAIFRRTRWTMTPMQHTQWSSIAFRRERWYTKGTIQKPYE